MTTYPLLSRICAVAPKELMDALEVHRFEGLLAAGNREALASEIDDAELRCLDRLIDLLFTPDMKKAMSIASIYALGDMEKYRDGRGRRYRYGARLQRSVIGYTTRSAVKPSPFSFFTRLGIASGGGSEIKEHLQLVPTLSTARALGEGLRRAVAAEPEDCMVNPTIRQVGERLLGWRAQYLIDGGFAWRTDEVVDATAWASSGAVDVAGLFDEAGLAVQLLDGSAVFVGLPSDEERPSKDQQAGNYRRVRLNPVDSLGVSADGQPDLPTVYHVVTEPRTQPNIRGTAAEAAIEEWLRRRLRIVSTYEDMAQWARAEYGIGTKVDLATFLIGAMLRLEDAAPKMSMQVPTPDQLASSNFLPPMAAVFWQSCPSVGPGVVIANNSNGPGLGSALRWGGDISRHARSQIDEIGDRRGAAIVPFTFGDEWNGIQQCGDAAFTWPNGRHHRPADLPLEEFAVEVGEHELRVLRNDVHVLPVYAGAMPEHRTTGTARIFGLLGHPWAFEYQAPTPETEVWEREYIGEALVSQRAGARVHQDLIASWKRLPLADALMEIHGWSQKVGLPGACFWRAVSGSRSTEASKRKPAFVDLSSPHLVAALLHTAPTDGPITIEEALPNSRTALEATEEFVSLVVLDKERSR